MQPQIVSLKSIEKLYEETADFWDSFSLAEFWDQIHEVEF
jgi:hypothetical protein